MEGGLPQRRTRTGAQACRGRRAQGETAEEAAARHARYLNFRAVRRYAYHYHVAAMATTSALHRAAVLLRCASAKVAPFPAGDGHNTDEGGAHHSPIADVIVPLNMNSKDAGSGLASPGWSDEFAGAEKGSHDSFAEFPGRDGAGSTAAADDIFVESQSSQAVAGEVNEDKATDGGCWHGASEGQAEAVASPSAATLLPAPAAAPSVTEAVERAVLLDLFQRSTQGPGDWLDRLALQLAKAFRESSASSAWFTRCGRPRFSSPDRGAGSDVERASSNI